MHPLRGFVVAILLASCGKGGEPAPTNGGPAPKPVAAVRSPDDAIRRLALPDLAAATATDPIPAGPLIVATPTAIVADGRAVASVTAGRIDPAVIDPPSHRVDPLVSWTDAWLKSRPAGAVVQVAIDPALPAVALLQVLTGLAVMPPHPVALLVRTPDGPRSIPVRARAPSEPPAPDVVEVALDDPRSTAELIAAIVDARADTGPVMLAWAPRAVAKVAPVKPVDEVALEEAEARRFADLLTSTGEDEDHTGDMDRRAPGADLGAQIAGPDDHPSQLGGGVMRGPSNGGGSIAIGGGTSAPPAERFGRISMSGGRTLDDTSLTIDAVKTKIMAAYLAGVKRCYKQALADDPSVRGKLTINLTVDEAGRATATSATAPTPELGDCVEGQLANWRFAIPKDADGEGTSASFTLALQLVPD